MDSLTIKLYKRENRDLWSFERTSIGLKTYT